MSGKVKEFFYRKKFALITFVALVVAFIGVYEIVVHSKSHFDFFPAIGSWVGGVATVYAVCIAIVEYWKNKKLEGINERIKINRLITDSFAPKLGFSELAFIQAKRSYESIVNKSEDLEKKYKDDLLVATKSLEDLDIEIDKLIILEENIKISSRNRYDDLKPFLDKIFDLRGDLTELSYYVDEKLFHKKNNNWSSELRKVTDTLSKHRSIIGIKGIENNHEYKEYVAKVENTIFKPFKEQIER